MLRAVSHIVMSRPAAMRMITAATNIQSRHAAQSSALVMAILTARALVQVILAVAGPVDTPKTILFTRRPARLLGREMLPLFIEEVDRLVSQRLGLHVRPAARHLVQHVPATLAIGLAVRQSAQPPDDAAHGLGREGRDSGAGRSL